MKQVLTIAGSDSGGGAGIQADLKTMTVLGVYGASVITAVTAQNTRGVEDFKAFKGEFVQKQLEAVISDLDFSAAKTGMLANKEIVKAVASKVAEYNLSNLVVDPVMVATSGDLLLAKEAVSTLREELIPLASVLTPNLKEAKLLVGKELSWSGEMESLARELYQLGARAVVLKGGHGEEELARDILYDGEKIVEFTAEKIKTSHTHGTGCTLSAALASYLALDFSLEEAVKKSKEFVTRAIKEGVEVGSGNNPVNQLGARRGKQ